MPSLPPLHKWPEKRRKPRPAPTRDTRDRSGDPRCTGRWKKLRLHLLGKSPLCRDPFGDHRRTGRVEPAVEIHHILPVLAFPDQAFKSDNLAPLCHGCHARLTAMERSGRGDAARAVFGK